MIIKSKRLFFKKVAKKDLGYIKNWRNSKGVWEFNSQYTLLNQLNQKLWYDEINSKTSHQIMFTIFNFKNKTPIGICGFRYFDSKNKSADVSILLGTEKYRGRKLGTEALDLLVNFGFNSLNLHHISARIFSNNYRSIKVFENMNFKLDATLRDCIWRCGKWWNIYSYSLLSHEYNNKKN